MPSDLEDDEQIGEGEQALDELGEKLAAFNVLRKSDEGAADAILEQLAGTGQAERDIMAQFAANRPIARPDRFEASHRAVMKSFEVLKRNGSRSAKLPKRLGPLKPVANWVVQLFTRLIVQSQLTRQVDDVRHLYARREAWALPGSTEARMLRRASWQIERLAPSFKGRALGLPGFLVGGAALTSLLGGLQALARNVLENPILVVLATLALLLVLLGAAWCVLRAAGVARRRLKLTTHTPMRALHEVMGSCGEPPKDDSLKFALLSLIAMAIAWIVIPVGIVLVLRS